MNQDFKQKSTELAVPDNGYTAICPECYKRYNLKDEVVGLARFVDLAVCEPCDQERKKARLKLSGLKMVDIP